MTIFPVTASDEAFDGLDWDDGDFIDAEFIQFPTNIRDDGLFFSDSLGDIGITDNAFSDDLDWDTDDSIDAALVAFITDTGLTISDSISAAPRRVRRPIDTGLTISDRIQKDLAKTIADTGLTITDSLGRHHSVTATDTGLTVSDTMKRTMRRVISDQGMTFGTSLVARKNGHNASVTIADTGLTIASSITRNVALQKAITDRGLILSDGVIITVNGGPPNTCAADFRRFLTDLDASSEYTTWCAANPGDCSTWTTYAAAILDGGTPAPPAMSTTFGDALVDAGIIALDGIVPCRRRPPPTTSPVAAFSFAVSGLTATFTNLSLPGASGPIISWLWTFGDGGTDTSTWNPSHTYAGGGTYLVTLTVVGTSPDGMSSVSHPVAVFVPSVVGFHIDAVIV